MAELQRWRRGSPPDSAFLPQPGMQVQNLAHKVVPRGMDVAVVELGAEEGVVTLSPLLLQLPRLRWKATLGASRWSSMSSCAGLHAAAFDSPLLSQG